MDFTSDKPIWKQIADRLADGIFQGQWPEGERIPSVRDLASLWGVNPNTVVRSYGQLEEWGAVVNLRGLGYSVTPGAVEVLRARKRQEFLEQDLPRLRETVRHLGLTKQDWEALWPGEG